MANKKVFTNLQFEGNSELLNPKLNPTGTAPASKGPGQAYFDTGTGGTLNLQFAAAGATNDWRAVHTSGVPFSTNQVFTSSVATGTAPFTIASASKVTNLNANYLEGYDTSTTAVANKIPVYATNGTLRVSDPLTGDDAANRRYVDSSIQGLDHKESVRVATTANIAVITPTNDITAGDTVDGTTLVAGDRILVKNQNTASQNGIYIVPASGAPSRAEDDAYGPNLLGTAGNFDSDSDLDSWSSNGVGTMARNSSTNYLKLTNPSAGGRARANTIAFATEIGKTYKFTYVNINDGTTNSGAGFAHLGTSAGGSDIKANVGPSSGHTWQATSEVVYIQLGVSSDAADKHTSFDDISITQVNLTEGAFVFVEEGTANANSSWVLQNDSTTWVKFSAAGLITAGDGISKDGNSGTLSVNVAAPISIASDNVTIADDAILSAHIADGQITPAQLVNSSSFTMGGLTVNKEGGNYGIIHDAGDVEIATYAGGSSGGIGTKSNHPFDILFNGSTKVQISGTTFHSKLTNFGIGADASSPSGTLHVSTARYGSEMVTNGDFASSSDWTGSDWVIANGVASIDGSQTGSRKLSQNIGSSAGVRYRITYEISGYTAGLVRFVFGSSDGGTYRSGNGTYTEEFVTTSSGNFHIQANASFNGSIDNVSVVEDTLSTSANLSVNSAADDLVIANNDHGGLSIITPADKKGIIFFGDKNDNDRGGIKYDHAETNSVATDERMEFSVNGDNKALTLHSDLSAKFEGGVGINGVIAGTDAVLRIRNENDSSHWPLVVENDNGNKSLIVSQTSAGHGILFLRQDADASNHVRLDSSGTSYFNGGNVAIGQASASNALDVQGGTTNTAIVARSSDAKAQVSLVDSGTTGVGSVVIGAESDDLFLTAGSGGTEAFRIKSNGTQDHKSNSIVNSATVAGLQDGGACYDFDGSSSNINLGTSLLASTSGTISAWVKADSLNNSTTIHQNHTIISKGDVYFALAHDENNKFTAYTYIDNTVKANHGTDAERELIGTTAISTGKWYHVVYTWNKSGSSNATQELYVNGVSEASKSDNTGLAVMEPDGDAGTAYIGRATQTSSHWDGQIRDVKIFPSALDAADIRKLYSGENPKKNLNVELITSWANGSSNGYDNFGTTASGLGLSVQADSTGSEGAVSNSISVASGDVYLVSFDLTLTSGTAPTVSIASSNSGWATERSNTVVSAAGTNNIVLTVTTTDTNAYLQFRSLNGQAASYSTGAISLTKITTLVDFTPQSASSSKWRNEAIPSLYHGTVNNATLSQGNSYWNNIKQSERNVSIGVGLEDWQTSRTALQIGGNGSLNATASQGAGGHFDIAQNAYINSSGSWAHINTDEASVYNQVGGKHNFKVKSSGNADSAITWTNGLTVENNGDITAHQKLGVGGTASSCQLRVAGTSEFENSIFIGTHDGQRGLISWSGDFDSGVGSAHAHLVIAGSQTMLGGLLFKTRNSSGDVSAGVVSADGNWAIGGTAAAQKLQVDGNIQLTNTAQTSSNFSTNIQSIIFGDEQTGTSARHQASINAVREAWNNSPCKLTFKTSADLNSATTKLEIASDGTQDHKSNSIVNSATVAGLQDGACYDFDGTGDKITIADDDVFDFEDFTVALWLNANTFSNNDRIITKGSTGNGEWMISAGSSNKIRVYAKDAAGNAKDTSGDFSAITTNQWNYVVVVIDRTNDKIRLSLNGGAFEDFVGGTDWTSNFANSSGIQIGTNGTTHFDGQIRDVKIFPSALTAGEIRKLYSGENPKKNLNVELIANGDFSDSIGSEWAGSTDATLTQNNGQLTVTSSGSNYGAAYAPISITEGKHYLLTFDMVDTNANSYIRVGTIDATNKTGPSQVSSNILSNAVVADGTTVRTFFVASSSQASDGYLAFGGRNDMTTLVLDNVSLTEVGTLVDFTPQSASSTKWRNEALLGFYDGTVNNATLSQGNSYWNNIKQDGTATTVDGSLEVQTASGGELNIDRNGNSGVAIQLKNNGDIASGTLKLAGGSGVTLFTNATEALSTAGGDVKVTGKLGVGGVAAAGAYSILCHGGSVFEDTMRFGDENGSKGFLGWNNIDSSPAQPGAHNHFRIGASKNATNAGISFITRNGGDVDAGVITREGYWGIGSTSPQVLFEARKPDASHSDGWYGSFNSDFDTGDWLGLHIGYGQTTSQNYRKTGVAFERTDGSYARGKLHIINDGAADNAAAVLGDSVHSWDYDGTQDHKSNRIVNSQTLNDSWRSSEPSLRFDGSDDYVDITGSFDFGGVSNFSVSVWFNASDISSYGRFFYDNRPNNPNSYRVSLSVDPNSIDAYVRTSAGGVGFESAHSTTGFVVGKWYHVVLTYNGVNLKLYLNGTEVGSDAQTGGIIDTGTGDYTGTAIGCRKDNNQDQFFNGEIKDVRIHNRAMEPDEIKGLYNGESAPWKYADAGVNLVTGGDMEDASDLGTAYGATLTQSNTVAHSGTYSAKLVDTGGSSGKLAKAFIAEAGKTYRVSGYYYPTSDMGNARLLIQDTATWPGSGENQIADTDSGSTFSNIKVSYITANQWNYVSAEWTATDTYNGTLYASWCVGDNANDTGTAYWDNVEVVQIGEVAAYTPQSIGETRDNGTSGNGKKWYDTTTNNNDGTITGATKVGRTHFGRLDIGTGGGSSAYDLDVGETGKGKLNRIDFYDSNRYIERDSDDLLFYSHYNGFRFNSGSVSNGTRSGGTSLQVNGDRSVTATSGSSTNLKQVARGFTTNFIQPTGKAFTSFRIDHNLGTQFIHVSVIENSGNQEVVECAVRTGSWTEGQTGANISDCGSPTGTTVTGVTSMGTENSNASTKTRYCMVSFATAPAVGTNYKVVVIGI